jgi:hypothetical protein
MIIKDYGERVFNMPVLDYVRSEDRNCIAIYNTADDNLWEITCFRLDKMQILWDKTVDRTDRQLESDDTHVALSNRGDFFLIADRNNKKSRLENHELRILNIQADQTERIETVLLRNALTTEAKFEYDNLHQTLVGAGLYADRTRERANGAFFVTLPTGNNTAQRFYAEPFDDRFLSIIKQKDVQDDTKGVADCTIRQLILRQDGGVLLVVERNHELQRGASSGRGFWRDGARVVVDFYFEDVFTVAFQPEGKVQWKTVLHKRQYSQDDEGTFSSYFLMRNADRLRFLFNDEIKFETTCSEYIMSPLGEYDRNSLFNTDGQNLRLRFRDAVQISSAECLIPSEYRNKLRLVLLRF